MVPHHHHSYLPSSGHQQTLLKQWQAHRPGKTHPGTWLPKAVYSFRYSGFPLFIKHFILLFLPCLWGHNLSTFDKLYLSWQNPFECILDRQVVFRPRELFPSCWQPGLISSAPPNGIDSVWPCSLPAMGGDPHGLLVPWHQANHM